MLFLTPLSHAGFCDACDIQFTSCLKLGSGVGLHVEATLANTSMVSNLLALCNACCNVKL